MYVSEKSAKCLGFKMHVNPLCTRRISATANLEMLGEPYSHYPSFLS